MIVELTIDLIALVLIAAGVWLLYPPAGLIVGGIGLWWLAIGIRARQRTIKADPDRQYRAIEVED